MNIYPVLIKHIFKKIVWWSQHFLFHGYINHDNEDSQSIPVFKLILVFFNCNLQKKVKITFSYLMNIFKYLNQIRYQMRLPKWHKHVLWVFMASENLQKCVVKTHTKKLQQYKVKIDIASNYSHVGLLESGIKFRNILFIFCGERVKSSWFSEK